MTASGEYDDTSTGQGSPEAGIPCCRQLEGVSFPRLKEGQTSVTGTIRFSPEDLGGGCVQCLTVSLYSTHPDVFMPKQRVTLSEEDIKAEEVIKAPVEAKITPRREPTL